MTTFAEAVKSTPAVARTENGMKAKSHSGNALVDLFYKIGASRGKSVTADFEKAFQEDADLAMKIAFWSRDVRGGAGERQIFRDVLVHLEKLHPEMLEAVLPFVSEFGRWDDLLVFKTEKFKHMAYTLIGDALRERNGLAAKWMPRQGPIAIEIRNFYGMSPKQYRKSLVALTNVVESKMCAGNWDGIEFGKLPSLASARYNKAFGRNAATAYAAYKARLTAGTDKVNASAVYPYDVIKTLRHGGDSVVADAQWASLPNYIGDASVLPLVDVSGSMSCAVGGNANLQCIDIALSLGLYCADKNTGVFKDTFLTFSAKPKAQVVKGTLAQKMSQMNSSDWGMNTNLHAAFEEILRIAVKGGVNASDMPKTLLILSDMQFDQCVSFDDSAHQMIVRKYKEAGYEVPNIVFWNLNSKDNVPVKFDKRGTALVSGFSPAVMKGVLTGTDMTPYGIMLATVDVPRYAVL
jgi:hypothetical protein